MARLYVVVVSTIFRLNESSPVTRLETFHIEESVLGGTDRLNVTSALEDDRELPPTQFSKLAGNCKVAGPGNFGPSSFEQESKIELNIPQSITRPI